MNNRNIVAINYYKAQMDKLGEITLENIDKYNLFLRIFQILAEKPLDTDFLLEGPHGCRVKSEYIKELTELTIKVDPNNILDNLEIDPIEPIKIDNDINNVETDISDDEEEEYLDELIDDDTPEYIPGTNILRPRPRGTDESYEDYADYLESYYDENESALNGSKTDNKSVDSEEKKSSTEESNGIEYIPGTKVPKPRNRETNESDEEYVNYLKEHYKKYEDLFEKEESTELARIEPQSKDLIPVTPKVTDIIPVYQEDKDLVTTDKKKKRFKVTNVFTPVKNWCNNFKRVVWPKIKNVFKKYVVPFVTAASLGIAGGALYAKHNNDKDTALEDNENVEKVVDEEINDNNQINSSDVMLGQMFSLNDGTIIYRNSDFDSTYGIIGNESSRYDDKTIFMVNALVLNDETAKENIEFNLVGKTKEEKKQVIENYIKYMNTHDSVVAKSHVTPVDENGKWLSEDGLGAWLNPNTSYISSLNTNEAERSLK